MEDAQIIELFWARDESAIDGLREKYGGLARRLAMNLLSSAQDAEECEQDAYLALWNSIPPERPVNLRAYLGRTVRNIAVNLWTRSHARKRDSGMTAMLDELSQCLPAPGDAQSALEERELGRAISGWLRGLRPEDRALFLRRYWYGDELRALAVEWGVPANRLAQRMHRLRASLRLALEKEGFSI